MSLLRFEDLTFEQKEFLVDDCGKPGFLDVPDFVFEIACERHDFDYWQGGNKQDRYDSDRRMYETMKEAIREEPWYRRYWLYPVAFTYYMAVRAFSAKFFHFTENKRGLEDLERAMEQESA